MSNEQLDFPGRPRWIAVLYTIASDMRHDIDDKLIEQLWEPKLKRYRDEVVCEALMRGKWTIFPNVNEVIEVIEMIEKEHRDQAQNRDWEKFQAEQKYAEENGLLATDADYAEMNERILKAVGVSDKPKRKLYPPSTAPSKEELERRRQEQLKALYEKYGKAK